MNQSLVWNFTKQTFIVCNSFVPLLLNSREIAGRWTSQNALTRTKPQTNRIEWGQGTKGAGSYKTLPKAKRTQGLSAFISSTAFGSYWSLVNQTLKSRPNFNCKILTKIQLQNLDQTSASKSQLSFNFKMLTKRSLVSTSIQVSKASLNNIEWVSLFQKHWQGFYHQVY